MSLPTQILLIVRFTTALPDLPLPINSPGSTTALDLKQLIRNHLPAPHSSHRLRLIHAGQLLQDTAPLSSSLSLPPPPPPRAKAGHTGIVGHGSSDSISSSKVNGEGKGKERAVDADEDEAPLSISKKVYIHCSIGDVLSPSELAHEAEAANRAAAALHSPTPSSSVTDWQQNSRDTSASSSAVHAPPAATAMTTTPAPQGFDRLLATGFTAAEVASLRAQFRANVAFTHTPDSMPSVAELRLLEDRWLDNDESTGRRGAAPAGGGVFNADEGAADEEIGGGGNWGTATWSDDGGIDDMLYGNVVGFFWPLGALGWGLREEGVWSRRRQIAVLTGFLVNILFGFLRLTS
ncbi:hypothetical protein K490DRAFT_62901 [Saccharata proteae CBS 121410]|uniref:Ubiquitin-like domain-containing protein n=1 Tax=Saccharata proteae CBS 121410 TaxID=1314787 RepID=A0A9P4M0C7_9PEZI|nr:hypothetical protein K490DRAFT_62901 [Saccharata proteae CBS 121410]